MPGMAIQFHCPGCGQPIEVDDEWASKLVACPYCRRTVSAPVQSTLDVREVVPSAKPVATSESAAPTTPSGWPGQAAAGGNIVALVAFALSMSAILAMLI